MTSRRRTTAPRARVAGTPVGDRPPWAHLNCFHRRDRLRPRAGPPPRPPASSSTLIKEMPPGENVSRSPTTCGPGPAGSGTPTVLLHGRAEEVADGVAFVPSFANVAAIATDDGLVLVDTGSRRSRSGLHDTCGGGPTPACTPRSSPRPHRPVFGVAPSGGGRRARNWVPPGASHEERCRPGSTATSLTAGYNEVVNRRQFGSTTWSGRREYRPTGRTADRRDLIVGGLELHHAWRDRRPHLGWVPGQKVLLCCGDLIIWASPTPATRRRCSATRASGRSALLDVAGPGAG